VIKEKFRLWFHTCRKNRRLLETRKWTADEKWTNSKYCIQREVVCNICGKRGYWWNWGYSEEQRDKMDWGAFGWYPINHTKQRK
jgi:hypothetical protein